MRRKKKELLVWTIICSMIVGTCSPILSKGKSESSVWKLVSELQNPQIVADDSLEYMTYDGAVQKPGKRVTWDCIWFGSYPQTEIVYEDDSETIATLETNTYNPVQYEKVDSSTWAAITVASFDSNGDAVVDGVKYRRMKSTDATARNDKAYIWKDDSSYHYFRYDPIKWRILSTDGEEAFLLADRGLDAKQYHMEESDVTWGTSTVRSWLNGYDASANASRIDYRENNFFDAAFNSEEKRSIAATEEFDDDDFGGTSGDGRQDKVFLLSYAEQKSEAYGLEFMLPQSKEREDRSLVPAAYARAMGGYLCGKGDYGWWLRSMGEDHTWAGCTCTTQYELYNVFWTFGKSAAVNSVNLVRPALRLSLDSVCYQPAGTVSSDNTVSEATEVPDVESSKAPTETPVSVPVQAPNVLPTDVPTTANISLNGRLRNPQIVADDSTGSGQLVTWDCIWFGSYPQTEVIEEGDTEAIKRLEANDESYKIEYEQIESNKWEAIVSADYNNRGDAVVDGVKYRRRQSKDVGHCWGYKWSDGYHYFRYEPIKWRVLSTEEGKTFLLADQCLDCKPYNMENTDEDVTWETSTVRSWLNGYSSDNNSLRMDYSTDNFFDDAFSSEEKSEIVLSILENKSKYYYMSGGTIGNATYDKVFLLSSFEVAIIDNPLIKENSATVYGFREDYINDKARRSNSSTYTKAMGVRSIDNQDSWSSYEYGKCEWWLRSHDTGDRVAYVQPGGCSKSSANMCMDDYGVRPAICVPLNYLNWYQYAGTVCSDGTVNEKSELPDIVVNPSAEPSSEPDESNVPIDEPSTMPSAEPDAKESSVPIEKPGVKPDIQPSVVPTDDRQDQNSSTSSSDRQDSSEIAVQPVMNSSNEEEESSSEDNEKNQKPPKRVTIKKIKKQKHGNIVIRYKKVSKADGYCIQYSRKKNFARKKQYFSKDGSVKLRLPARKKYYIRVRAYKYIYRGGKTVKINGAWSRVKKVKTKR